VTASIFLLEAKAAKNKMRLRGPVDKKKTKYAPLPCFEDFRLRLSWRDFFTAFLHRQVTAPDLRVHNNIGMDDDFNNLKGIVSREKCIN
jgi:hypothetical protein